MPDAVPPTLATRAYVGLTLLLVAGVATQVALAGLAVFGAAPWSWHVRFSWFVEALPLLLFGFALVGRLRGRLRWTPLLILGLIMLQHGSAAVGGAAGAFHAVNALAVFGLALDVARRTRSPQTAAPSLPAQTRAPSTTHP